MTTEDRHYTPLLERHGLRQGSRPREAWRSVPEEAGHFLREWCDEVLTANFDSLYRTEWEYDSLVLELEGFALAQSLDIELPLGCTINFYEDIAIGASPEPIEIILKTARDDHDVLLDIADYLLVSGLASTDAVASLRHLLAVSYSAWRVKDDASGLALRVSPEEEEAYRDAISPGDETSGYLAAAWDAAWRREQPSAKEAYDGAVNAIEAVLAPIVIPNESKPTLGKIIGELKARHNQGKWDTRFRGTETVQALKGLLYELWQTNGRHAGMPANTLEQAQDAVTIAVAVVALTRRGFLKRVDDS